MALSSPAAPRIAAGALLLLLFLLPSVGAQAPEPLRPVAGSALAIVVLCNDTLLEPRYAGDDEVTCLVQDLSRDSFYLPGSTSGTSANYHHVTLAAVPRNESAVAQGWQVEISRPFISLAGGDIVDFVVRVKATPTINTQDFHFDLVANYTAPNAYNSTQTVPFSAEVEQYDFALLSWSGAQAQKAGQDDVVVYSVLVQNTGVYPDSYRFSVTSAPDLKVSTPANVYVPAGESRVVNISVLTPHGKVYEMGRSETLGIKVSSVTGSGVYSTTGVLQIRGSYIPLYWIPLVVVGLVSGAVVVRGQSERAEMRRLEKGRPRRVDLTPRQTVLLAELKRSDPDAYKQKKAALDNVYKERASDYREHRREREAKDREEAKIARAEFLAQKKARKAQRAEEKRAAKVAKQEEAREAKVLRKKEKELAKTRKVLLKRKAKADKRDAKLAAKQAKIDAKQAAKDAKIAAKEAKAAAKAEKAARKAESKKPKE